MAAAYQEPVAADAADGRGMGGAPPPGGRAPARQQPGRAGRERLPRAEQRPHPDPELCQARAPEPRPGVPQAGLREDPGGGPSGPPRSPAASSAWPGHAPTGGRRPTSPGWPRRSCLLTAKDLSNHRVRADFQAEGHPHARVNPAQIQQVLLNLVINARQAMPEGGTVRVAVGLDASGRLAEVSVADTGRGIAPARPPADLRAVLHDQVGPGRDRPGRDGLGPLGLPRDRRGASRPAPGREPDRPRDDLHPPPAGLPRPGPAGRGLNGLLAGDGRRRDDRLLPLPSGSARRRASRSRRRGS